MVKLCFKSYFFTCMTVKNVKITLLNITWTVNKGFMMATFFFHELDVFFFDYLLQKT